MLEIKGVKISPSLFGKFFFGLYSHHAMHTTVLVTKTIYRDKSEFVEERKISKFYRALVTGILANDEVLPLPLFIQNTVMIS